jgi:hemolysin III
VAATGRRRFRLPRLEEETHTPAEELANVLTHGLGAALACAGLAALLAIGAMADDPLLAGGLAVYGVTLTLVYAASALYHGTGHPRLRDLFKRFDQAAIFLFIAGSYTPFALYVLGGGPGWGLLGLVWALALAGIVFKTVFHQRLEWATVGFYLAMGWVGIAALGPIAAGLGPGGTALLVGGGVAYTAGIAFYVWHALPFNHAVWHVFVMVGSALHFAAVVGYVALPEIA